MQTFPFTMLDILPLLPVGPANNNRSINVPCPACNDQKRHLNINLEKNVYRCNRCGEYGGVLDLYCLYYPQERASAFNEISTRLKDKTIQPASSSYPKKTVGKQFVHQSILADVSIRDNTYRTLLGLLSLSNDHQQNLMKRGLSSEMIRENLYRTVPVAGQSIICKKLQDKGCLLSGVPGFYQTRSGHWMLVPLSRGFLIPVLDINGKIQGLTIRLDQTEKSKYRWVSSYDYPSGVKAYGWVHVAGTLQKTVILTEGHLKGEIIHRLSGKTVIAVPGVNNLSELKLILPTLRDKGVEHIMIAYDMDFLRKKSVYTSYLQLRQVLQQYKFTSGTYFWPPKHNGLDDFIVASNNTKICFY